MSARETFTEADYREEDYEANREGQETMAVHQYREEDESEDDMTLSSINDEQLPPVTRLAKYADSDIIFNRQVVARGVLETLRAVFPDEDEVGTVISVMRKLGDDSEPSVRAELVEQIPLIAMFCYEHCHQLGDVIPKFLVPTIVKYLLDINNQVRKNSQATLLVMLEQRLIDEEQLEEKICPLVVQLTEVDNFDDHRTEAAALMSRIAVLLGREMTERLFLQSFGNLCLDTSFHVRKVCASNFGDLCKVVGTHITEEYLLPKFYYLCEDGVWGVRKACAEVFMMVSQVCSMETRYSDLASLFLTLLCDQSRWVRIAAFQALGPFISTFADPSKTGLYYNEDGYIVVKDANQGTTDSETSDTAKFSGAGNDAHVLPVSTNPHPTNTHTADGITPVSLPVDLNKSSNDAGAISTVISECGDGFVASANQDGVDMEIMSDDTESAQQTDAEETVVNQQEESVEERMAKKYAERQKCSNVVQSVVTSHNQCSQSLASSSCNLCTELQSSTGCSQVHSEAAPESVDNNVSLTDEESSRSWSGSASSLSPLTVTAKKGQLHVHVDNESAFNNFQFWRIPIPELKLDISIEDGKPTSFHVRARILDRHQVYTSDLNVQVKAPHKEYTTFVDHLTEEMAKTSLKVSGPATEMTYWHPKNIQIDRRCIQTRIQSFCVNTVTDLGQLSEGQNATQILTSSHNEVSLELMQGEVTDIQKARVSLCGSEIGGDVAPFPCESPYQQDVVPADLLHQFVSMTNPARTLLVDTEITRHCAYSLPGVALTLGRKNWPCLKETYQTLASDMQWKVRRTIASSIHELAHILGADLAARDLLPVFSGFLRDLDEVRVGVLQHLSHFLRNLRPSDRSELLPHLAEFQKMDNDRNWRFRLILAQQLIPIVELYSPVDIKECLVPMALSLVRDKVCEVRHMAFRLVAVSLHYLSQSPDPSLAKGLLADLAEKFTHSSKWSLRQTYSLLCEQFINEKSLPLDQFARDVLPHLLYLCWDSIANVRLSVARCLSQSLLPLDYFSSTQNPHHELLLQALRTLQSDVDRDVRYFALLSPPSSAPASDQV